MGSAIPLLKILTQLFLLMLAGFVLRKTNIVDSSGRKLLTNVVMDFLLPCSILKSFVGALSTNTLQSCLVVFLVSLGISALGAVLGLLFRTKKPGTDAVLRYGLICSNATFMGSPLISAIFGSAGLVYWAIYMIPFRVAMWTYGTALFTHPKGKDIVKKFLLSPCVIATFLGIVLMLIRIQLPAVLMSTLSSAGSCVTGLTMIVIGGLLAESKFSEVFNKLTLSLSVVRLVIMPIVVLFLCLLLKLEPMVTGVCTALAGMPIATTTAMFAEKYDGDTKLAAQAAFVTTLLSLVTVTLIMMLFSHFCPGIIIG